MSSPRLRRRLFSAAGTAAVLAALAAANVLSSFVHARLDLSAGRSHSLSAGTRRALKGLEQPLLVEVFFTAGLPAPFSLNERRLRDLLDDYRAAAPRGRVKVAWHDPSADPDAARRAQEAGVPPVQVNTAGQGRFEAKQAQMGLVLHSAGRSETLPVVDQPGDLEYQLTLRLRRLSGRPLKKVGFVTGHGERGPGDTQLAGLFAEAAGIVEPVAVSLDKPLPAGLAALWVVGPSARLKPAELEALAAFARSGGTVGVAAGSRLADFVRFQASPVDAGLAPLLARWGVSLSPGLAADSQSERIGVQAPMGRFASVQVVDYPFLPVATRLAGGHPVSAGLESVPFPFVSPVRFDPAAAPGTSYVSLADSSPTSRLFEGGDITPRPADALPAGKPGPFSLAGTATGPAGRLAVVGTSYHFDPRVASSPAVRAFALNLLEWSGGEDSLLSTRGRGEGFRPLAPMDARSVARARWLLILALPAAAAAALGALAAADAGRRRGLPALYEDA